MIGRVGNKALTAIVLAAAGAAMTPLAAQAGPYAAQWGCPNASMTGNAVADYMNAVYDAVAAGAFKNSLDRERLLGKVDAAWSKASTSKWSDARVKLQDVEDTADALASAPKRKLLDAAAIDAAVLAAQACMTP